MSLDGSELTIGEVARRAGVATSAIRYYERIGLLPPAERVSGQRRYGEEALRRLAFIAVAQNAGFTLREIAELAVGGYGDDPELAAPMRALSERKLAEVRAEIERAQAMSRWLEVATGCDCSAPSECALFAQSSDDAASLDVIQVPAGPGCRLKV